MAICGRLSVYRFRKATFFSMKKLSELRFTIDKDLKDFIKLIAIKDGYKTIHPWLRNILLSKTQGLVKIQLEMDVLKIVKQRLNRKRRTRSHIIKPQENLRKDRQISVFEKVRKYKSNSSGIYGKPKDK